MDNLFHSSKALIFKCKGREDHVHAFQTSFHKDSQQNFINKEWNIHTETCITLLVIYITIYKACN